MAAHAAISIFSLNTIMSNVNPILKRGACSACGTAPVNHAFFFTTSVVEGIVEPVFTALFGWIPIAPEGRFANAVSTGFLGLLSFLHIATFDTDPEKACSGRSKLIWDEAERRGISMQQLMLFGKHFEQ